MTLPVAHFGEEGAYAAEAAGRLYPEAELVACHSIPDVVRAVTRGDAGCGVLPIENSLAGVVPETYDVLAHAPLSIVDETVLAVPVTTMASPSAAARHIAAWWRYSRSMPAAASAEARPGSTSAGTSAIVALRAGVRTRCTSWVPSGAVP